ncbi:MAG: nucleotidyltransferase family protein [Gemmatimonadaceae bacterium]|nr:nucleotidyltransferase family protein [Gemmatimonadaceae bacterium]
MKAVILARGLGTRMRRADDGAALNDAQRAAAEAGVKAMMPLEQGRPFLHFVISALADAGVHEICLVVAPDAAAIQRHFHFELTLRRVRIAFAVQPEPRGTADALAAAEGFTKGERFLALNADNYYPVEAYRGLAALPGAGVAGFDRVALVRQGNIPLDRIRHYALLKTGPDGRLVDVVEKPDERTWAAMGDEALVSMNLWAFTPAIFEACRRIAPSARGELELPDAVRLAIRELGLAIDVVPCKAPVFDLSSRADVSTVSALLKGARVVL